MSLNLFYEETETDRWLPWDRYPRRVIRRLVRGRPNIGGQQRLFLNLCVGLDKISARYRVNDYRHARKHPDELACIVGKPHVLDKIPWKNPILFGAAVLSHPLQDPHLLKRLPIKKVLVPGEWMRKMWEPHYGKAVVAWPVGIDTDFWAPPNHRTIAVPKHRRTDFLIYDKVRWEHERYEEELLQPIRSELTKRGLRFCEIRYGFYKEGDFHHLLGLCKAMLFVCTHETQGIAYQQALSAGVPILAWDRGGICADPNLLRLGVCFGPVSSVPYWDSRCGMKFADVTEFPSRLDVFWDHVQQDAFQPRDYILENLTLEKCARHYLEICNQVTTSPNAKPKQILHETAETTEG